ncbi:unnamed protein product, partial [Adineta ricciae]
DLQTALPTYRHYGVGRDDGKTKGEYSAIFYRADRFDLLKSGTFWLSETPTVVGSKGWDTSITRICSWTQVRDKRTQQTFYHFNTHYDHRGTNARLQSSHLILNQIKTIAGATAPVILTGDLNATPNSDPYRAIIADTIFKDAYTASELPHCGPSGTFSTFNVSNKKVMHRCNCGSSYSNQTELDRHKTSCSNISYFCSLCHEEIPTKDMSEHLVHCGTKTEKCPNCQKFIQRSIYNYHLENNCIISDEDDLEMMSNTGNDKEETVPCEFCRKQIKFCDYNNHTTNCNRRRDGFDIHRLIRDCTTESTTSATSQSASSVLVNTPSQNDTTRERKNITSVVRLTTSTVRDSLSKDYYPIEVDHVVENFQFNIILIGSPRVGKSQLINALCGEENIAETSPGLNSCTKEIKCYTLKDSQLAPDGQSFQINFYDTPGIESWIEQNGEETMKKLIEEKNPICVIYCAAPGTFADLNQLHSILKMCKDKQIFCALVCTNMWSNPGRKVVIDDFKKQLAFFGEENVKSFDQGGNRQPHHVTLFGHGALCTMVNSVEYYDPDLSAERKPLQGVDELIHCIMEALDEEKLVGWCTAVLYRRSFWEKVLHKTNGFFSRHFSDMRNFFDPNSRTSIQSMIRNLFQGRR